MNQNLKRIAPGLLFVLSLWNPAIAANISRLHSSDIQNGNQINADFFNNEFNQLVNESNSKEGRVTSLESSVTALSSVSPVGIQVSYAGASAPTGWLFCNGRTIGSSSSGATARANADTANLYTVLWGWSNAVLPIQDSAGNPSSRGATAAADFAANKRLPLPDRRGRTAIGLDNMGGAGAAGRVTSASLNGGNSTTIGGSGGEQAHVQTVSELAAHTHGYQDAYAGGGGTYGGAAAWSPADQSRTTNNTGSSAAMNVMNPWLADNFIIKL